MATKRKNNKRPKYLANALKAYKTPTRLENLKQQFKKHKIHFFSESEFKNMPKSTRYKHARLISSLESGYFEQKKRKLYRDNYIKALRQANADEDTIYRAKLLLRGKRANERIISELLPDIAFFYYNGTAAKRGRYELGEVTPEDAYQNIELAFEALDTVADMYNIPHLPGYERKRKQMLD